MQKGSVLPLVILITVLIASGLGAYLYKQGLNKNQVVNKISIPNKEKQVQTFTDQNLNIKFKYPATLQVVNDTEEEFNKRGNGNFRKNFTSYVTYAPAKFLGGVVVLEMMGDFEKSPLTVWVFEKNDNLSEDEWYNKYWYYPFVWGDYTSRRNNFAPTQDATVSGKLGKSGIVTYQPGQPKFIYLSNGGKMYLFKVIGEMGEQVLKNVRFLRTKCPETKGINCMPIVVDPEAKRLCERENLEWISNNCPDIQIVH